MVIFQFAKCERLPEGRVREFAVQDGASTTNKDGELTQKEIWNFTMKNGKSS